MLLLKVVGMLLKYELNELAITSGSLIMMPFSLMEVLVEIFEHLNKLPSKPPLYEANEFYVLETLLVATVSDLRDHFCSSSLYFFHFINVST